MSTITSPTSTAVHGVAGRTNYAQWDKLATDLVEQVDEQEKEEAAAESAKLGLDGKYAVSQADADERAKSSAAASTKAKLDAFRERENQLVHTVANRHDDDVTLVLTRADFGEHQRVLRITDCTSTTIVLSPDLSLLESRATNTQAKEFPDDAENAEANSDVRGPILGLIKVFVENVSNVELQVHCKILTGCIELLQCHDTKLTVTTHVPTIQVDLCHDMQIVQTKAAQPSDRILHAGCKQLSITRHAASTICNYIEDGAVAVGNATPEEYQFVTTLKNDKLVTQPVKDEAPPKDPSATAETLKARGNEAFGAGEYAQAILHYSMSLDQLDTTDTTNATMAATVYTNRAACFLKLGEHEKALADADAALQHSNNTYVKAWFRGGLALHAAGRYREALEYLGKAQKLEPKNGQVQQALKFSEMRMEQEMRKRMGK